MRGYRIDPRDRKDLTLARYIYNVEISNSLYNSLHILEVDFGRFAKRMTG